MQERRLTVKTNELIQELSRESTPFSPADGDSAYLLKWTAAAAGAMAVWFIILPTRQDLIEQLSSPRFLIESATWLAFSVSTGFVAARSRLPGARTQTLEKISLAIGALLILEMVTRSSGLTLHQEFDGEMSWWRGRCGPLIIAMAMSWSGGLFYWMRKGAVLNPAKSGTWAAISAGSLSAFAMQLICAHENTVHLLIWHVLPTALLGLAGFAIGRRVLRW
jgi:hypothetical protein